MKLALEAGYGFDGLRAKIRECDEEGHMQQVLYSIDYNSITQVCFRCCKVRTCIPTLEILAEVKQ